ncbi:hypothetical protein Tco_1050162 [Tanacetum coccineum]
MMGGHSRLKNFMNKFTGTVRFRNDHFGAIMGYGDYVIGDSVIFREAFLIPLRYEWRWTLDDVVSHNLSCILRGKRSLVSARYRMLDETLTHRLVSRHVTVLGDICFLLFTIRRVRAVMHLYCMSEVSVVRQILGWKKYTHLERDMVYLWGREWNGSLTHDTQGKPQHDDKGFIDSGCSRHMIGNIAYLSDFK